MVDNESILVTSVNFNCLLREILFRSRQIFYGLLPTERMLVNFLRVNAALQLKTLHVNHCLFFRYGATTRLDLPRKRWFTNMRDYSRFYWPVINLPPGNYQGYASPLRTRRYSRFSVFVPSARLLFEATEIHYKCMELGGNLKKFGRLLFSCYVS